MAFEIVAVAITVVGLALALWLLIKRAGGRPRVLGIIGTVLILLGVLSRFAYQWMVERFLGQVDDAAIISVLVADTVIGSVLLGAGLLLVARAIVVAGRLPKI